MMGHLNSFSASGGGNLNKHFPKIQMPGGLPGGGMLKLRFDWYITFQNIDSLYILLCFQTFSIFVRCRNQKFILLAFFKCDDVFKYGDIINDFKLSPISYGVVTGNVAHIHRVLCDVRSIAVWLCPF